MSAERFRGPGTLYLGFVALLAAVTIFKKTILFFVMKLIGMCAGKKEDSDELRASQRIADISAGNDKFSKDIISDLRIATLADKYRKSVVDLNDVQKYELREGGMMDAELHGSLLEQLKKRLRWIEAVIDSHVQCLCDEEADGNKQVVEDLVEDGLTTDKLKNDSTYEGKLAGLVLTEESLMAVKTRDKKAVLRMKGITQSYFMYDSIVYKPLRALLMELKGEEPDKSGYSKELELKNMSED